MTNRTVSSRAGFNLFGTIIRAFAAWRQRREQRLALVALLHMSPERLDDLGIDILDVTEALCTRQSVARARQDRVSATRPVAAHECPHGFARPAAAPAN